MAGKYWWQDSEEENEKKHGDAKQSEATGYWWQGENLGTTIGNKATEQVNNWLKKHNSYISDYQKRYANRKYSYEDAYVKDSASWLDTVSKQADAFEAEKESILSYMDQYKGYLDEEWMESVRTTLGARSYDQKKIRDVATKDNEWWNSFGSDKELLEKYGSAEGVYQYQQRAVGYHNKYSGMSRSELAKAVVLAGGNVLKSKGEDRNSAKEEADWLASYIAGKDYDELLHLDEAKEQKQLDYSVQYLEDIDSVGRWAINIGLTPYNMDSYAPTAAEDKENFALYKTMVDRYGDLYKAEQAVNDNIAEKQGRIASSAHVKEQYKWMGVGNPNSENYDPTFGYYSKIGASKADNPINSSGINKFLEEDEVAVYNYYLGKYGEDEAKQYLDTLTDVLRYRQGNSWVDAVNDISFDVAGLDVLTPARQVIKGGMGLAAGVEQFGRGVGQLISNEEIDASSLMYANAAIAEDLDGFNALAYQGTNVLGNMLPSIALSYATAGIGGAAFGLGTAAASTLGKVVGTASMSLSAAGNAYVDGLNYGMTTGEARVYGTLVGIAEGALEHFIGGIPGLSKADDFVTAKIGMIKDGLLSAGSKVGWNVIKEIFEEEAQNYLEPAFRAIFTGEYDAPTVEELIETAIVTAVSTSAINAADTKINDAHANRAMVKTGKDIMKREGGVDSLLEQADYMAGVTTGYDQQSLMKQTEKVAKKMDNGSTGRSTAREVGKLAYTVQNQTDAQNHDNFVQALTSGENGIFDKKDANNIADVLVAAFNGRELTKEQTDLLDSVKSNPAVQSIVESQSRKNIEKLRTVLENANLENPATYKALTDRIGEEGRFGVSESGKAVIRGTDEEIDVSTLEVATVGDGQMTFQIGDRDVSAGDIDFADDNQSFLVSAVSNIENITAKDATAIIHDVVDMSKPLGMQLNGIDEAYTYGFHGYSVEDLKAGEFGKNLTDKQLMSAYELGKAARKDSDIASDASAVKMRTAAEAKMTAEQKTAKQKARIESDDVEVYFEDGGKVVKFDEHTGKYDKKRKAAVNTAKFLSKLGIGGKYYFFESYLSKTLKDKYGNAVRVYKDADGNEVAAPNGAYYDADGSIHIDLNAGDAGQGTALFTMGHELGHFIKAKSKKQFKILGDLVKEAFDKTDLSMHERVLAKQKFLEDKRGKAVSYEEAYEEVVCDALSTMLSDGSFYEKVMEIKVKDKGLFNTIKRFFQKMIAKFKEVYAKLTPDQQDARDIREMKDMFDKIQTAFVEGLVEASDNFHAAMESVVEENAESVSADEIVTDGAVVTDGNGERHSIRSMKHDIAEGKMFDDLMNVCGWTKAQVNTLRTQLKDLVEYMTPFRDILDMNESYGREGRRFSPYKPNSDPLYKISMDFSTLCSKRLLTQYVIENLQLREKRPMSAEEQMAIRDMLNEYRKVEKGLQVACAMCYVEAARLKSPKQIQRWLDDPTPHLINYFALKNTEFNASVKEAQADFKESRGYDRNAPKKDMKPADVKELNKIGPNLRSQYQLSAEEQAIVERAKTLQNETYLTAGNLANLSETDPAIYAAYTSFVRTATRSKSLETDEPYYYGDSTRDNGNGIIVSDSFIEAVNRENGMRFSSWSDWRIQHLLDYITAVIDNSVRGAAMHGYTKFGDEVRVLGKTGMMFNMSGVTGTQTGLNEDGSLNFSETESIDVNEAILLRDEFPDTAGLQCIGVSNEHIIALLRSDIIDYVIPYHVSGLNAALRRMADIYGWKDYTGTQHASIDKSIKFENAVDKEHWHEEPVFSEFFVGYDTGMTGIEAMRASAEKYKQLCRDRGLTPKFNQFATEENYWKLLIDRKMINQQTGNLIRQKAVTPTFDFDTIKGVVDKFVDNYDAGLEARALNHIVENWDSIPQRIKDLKKQGSTKATKTKKAVSTLANQTVAAQQTKNSTRGQKWKPSLDSVEWGIVNYAVDHNKGTAITNTCNMFFEKSKGRTLFGIYSTDDSTLLYASRGQTAEREHIFADCLREEYENGNVTDTSAEGLGAWAKTVRLQPTGNNGHSYGDVAPGRSSGDAAVYGKPSGLYSSAALRSVLANILQEETTGRTGDRRVRKSDRDSEGNLLSKAQQEFFKDSEVRWGENLMPVHHGTYKKFTVFNPAEGYDENRVGGLLWAAKDAEYAKGFTSLYEPIVMKGYLNITNMLDIGDIDSYENYENRLQELADLVGLTPSELEAMATYDDPVKYIYDITSSKGFRDRIVELGYDGVMALESGLQTFGFVDSNQFKNIDNLNPTTNPDVRYSDRDNAPTFYSQMAKVVDGMKQEKFGASSVISMLRGRGVKAEEIRWSGIQAFLDGKKSVTKAELLEFINGSMLHIEEEHRVANEPRDEFVREWQRLVEYLDAEEILDGLNYIDTSLPAHLEDLVENEDLNQSEADHLLALAHKAVDSENLPTKWDDYKLSGGENYRELVFKMPGSDYSNNAMRTHWGDDAQGVLAHARIQDFNTFIGKMLFIEEIQSDWHNAGNRSGYEGDMTNVEKEEQLEKVRAEFMTSDIGKSIIKKVIQHESKKGTTFASEQAAYDWIELQPSTIGAELATEYPHWATPERLQAIIELDESVSKLNRSRVPEAPFKGNYHEYVLKRLLRMAAEEGYDSIGWTTADIQSDRWSDDYAEGYRIEYDQDIPKFLRKYGKQWDSTVGKTVLDNGTEVWSMAITDAMQKSVLEEGQAMYSERGNGTSNRSLLANAFEGLSQNSEEYKMIQEYRENIKDLNDLDEKLSKLNAEIREIRFTEGKYDAKKLKELETEAKSVAESINRQDRKLLDMEVSEPFRKVIEQERKKEAHKVKAHVKEIQQNKKQRAEQTEIRHKIRKAVRDLDKLLNRGNKKQNVKEDMKGFVSKALELADYLFTDHISNDELIRKGITVPMRGNEAQLVKETEDIIAKLDAATDINQPGSKLTDEEFTRLDEKRKKNLEKLKDLLTEQRNARLNTPVAKLFDDLVKSYASLKNSSQDAVKAAYNEELEKSLRAFMSDDAKVKILENMRVADMTTEELNWLYRAYTMVMTNVRNANKFHVKGMTETIDQKVGRIVSDFGSRKIPDKKTAIVIRNLFNKMGWDYEKLHYALDRIGSDAFTELIMNLANSENIVMADVIEAAAFRDRMVENYGFNDWDVNKQIDREFLDNTGKKFKLTLGELMSLYAYSRREGAWDHIEYGGFVFGKNDVTNPKPADTYKLSKEQCEAITNTLTKEQKGYVEDMQKFLSETMGAKGNEVSMMLYGIRMFGEKNYFPIHIAGEYMARANESQAKAAAGFGTMSNAGFTHEQNPNAKAPFVLEGFNDVWVDHVNEMSRYHGAVPALEDIRRVMNRSSYSDAYLESLSVKAVMENAFGKDAVDYFDNLYREANSGAITDKLQRIPKKLLSLFRKNSVAYSLSVLIQQPTSIIRAYAMIPKKYFGLKGFGTITSGVVKAVTSKWNPAYVDTYNKMLKYAPGVTMAKEIGGFDTHTGGSIRSYLLDTNKSLKQKWKTGTALEKGKAALDLVDNNAIANLPNVADKIAWIEIWNACERETVATRKDLVPNSEEFLQAVGDRFTEVIRATQVYDSIFAKSPMMKSKNLAVQYLTSFMNEPNTVANMAESAVRDAVRGDWKSGAKKAIVLVYGTIAVGLMKSIIYALRDDDEDETYAEKYIDALVGSLVSDFNPLSYIPVVRDISSALQGYDVERPDMAIVVDAIEALQAKNNLANKDTEDMTEAQLAELEKKMDEATWDVVESLASFFGIPVKNIRRDVKAIFVNKSADAGQATKLSLTHILEEAINNSQYFFLRDESKSKQDKLYEALVAGDKTYANRLKAGYKDEDAYNSAVRKVLRENDPRIHEAALAYYNGNITEYKRIFKEIRNEDKHNIIGFDNTMEAVMSEVSAIKGELNGKTENSAYNATDFVNAVLVGNADLALTMKEDIISYKVAHGSTQKEAEESFSDSVATSTRNAFDSGLLDEAGTEKMLLEYTDMDEEEVADKVDYWAFMKAHPQYRGDLSQSNVEDYHEFAEPAEIPLDVFVQYVEGTSGLQTIRDEWGDEVKSKREQVLEVIDSLPLTWQQKDALYLAAGYAESKIWDVPW